MFNNGRRADRGGGNAGGGGRGGGHGVSGDTSPSPSPKKQCNRKSTSGSSCFETEAQSCQVLNIFMFRLCQRVNGKLVRVQVKFNYLIVSNCIILGRQLVCCDSKNRSSLCRTLDE